MAKVVDVVKRLVRGPDYWEQRAKQAEDELYLAKLQVDSAQRHAAHVEMQRKGWEDRARHAEKQLAAAKDELWLTGRPS